MQEVTEKETPRAARAAKVKATAAALAPSRFKPQVRVTSQDRMVKLPSDLWDKIDALGYFIQGGDDAADRHYVIEQAVTLAIQGEKQFAEFYASTWPALKAKRDEADKAPAAMSAAAGR